MIKSMTGFGRGEYLGEYKQVSVEVKTVNHRYGEIMVRLPRQYTSLEEMARRYILQHITRPGRSICQGGRDREQGARSSS